MTHPYYESPKQAQHSAYRETSWRALCTYLDTRKPYVGRVYPALTR